MAVTLLLTACASTGPLTPTAAESTAAESTAAESTAAESTAAESTAAESTAAGPTAPEPGLYGIRDGSLVRVGDTGTIGAGASAALAGVAALTYDPAAGRFYGIAGTSRSPRLIAVDAATGEAEEIGVITVPGLHLTLAEAIAFHPGEGTLYAAGGKSTFASGVLFTVDPATAEGRQVASVRGTIQNDVDAMTFAGETLYAVDGAGGSSALYTIDPITGEASRLTDPFSGTLTDLALDPAGRRLLGNPGTGEPLLAFPLGGGEIAEVPAGEEPFAALAAVPDPGAPMLDEDFESGDAAAWSKQEQR